ncbi:MAG: COG1470 family protein [Candidatus Thorarchaeota archaeon]
MRKIFVFLCVLFLISIGVVEAVGIGASPSEVRFRKVLRGGYAETTIRVSNPNPNPAEVRIELDGDTSEWLTFRPGTSFEIPAEGGYTVTAIIQPPEDLSIGEYKGYIYVRSSSSSGETGTMGAYIASGARLNAVLEITGEEIVSYIIDDLSVKDTEIDLPIELTLTGINRGNVRVTPEVHVDIWDRDQTRIIKSLDLEGSEVLPTTKKTDIFKIPSDDLKEDQYWMNVSVHIKDNLIETRLLTFDVLEKGALRIKGKLIHIVNELWVHVGELVKIDVEFANTGELTVPARFKGEVYFGEKLIDLLESDELDIAPGETVNLTTYYTPNEVGRYVIRGKVYYSKKVTYPSEGILNVIPPEKIPLETPYITWIIVALIIIIVVLIFRNLRRSW